MNVNTDHRIITLMYHRIEEPDTNPWGICVSPVHFDEQVQVIKKYFPVITAEQVTEQVTAGAIPETSVCITFDDGYADNYTNALTVLKKHNCRATFFIASAFIGNATPYWWDELEIIFLHTKHLPVLLALAFDNKIHSFTFEAELTGNQWKQHVAWQWYEAPPTKRCQSFISLWTLLRVLPYPDIEKRMNIIRSWANANPQSRLPMNAYQLQSLCSEKLASIGLHTHTHLNLARHRKEVQTEDILAGKEILADEFKTESSILAYPYGSFNEATISVVKDIGMKGCFTTEPELVTTTTNLMKLSRYQVFNWNGQEFEKNLLKWVTE